VLEDAQSKCPSDDRKGIDELWEECRARIFETHLSALRELLDTTPSEISGLTELMAKGPRDRRPQPTQVDAALERLSLMTAYAPGGQITDELATLMTRLRQGKAGGVVFVSNIHFVEGARPGDWYCWTGDNELVGPVGQPEIIEMIETGELRSRTTVQHNHRVGPADTFAELEGYLFSAKRDLEERRVGEKKKQGQLSLSSETDPEGRLSLTEQGHLTLAKKETSSD
jgi:hypothetical protein